VEEKARKMKEVAEARKGSEEEAWRDKMRKAQGEACKTKEEEAQMEKE